MPAETPRRRVPSKRRRTDGVTDRVRRVPVDPVPRALAGSTNDPDGPRSIPVRHAGPDVSVAAWHEAGHAVIARLMGTEIDLVSVGPEAGRGGRTVLRGSPFDARPLSMIPWWKSPDLEPVARELHCILAGTIAESLSTQPLFASAAAARAAFEATLDASHRHRLEPEEAAEAASDAAKARQLAVDFAGTGATQFLEWLTLDVRQLVLENAEAIAAVAVELERGSVLDGTAVDMILALGEVLEAEAGPPTSGQWTPITTYFVADVDAPARVGEAYPWHDPRVRRGARDLLMPADTSPELLQQAIADHRRRAMSPEPVAPSTLGPGPGVLRCVRPIVLRRSRNGLTAANVKQGAMIRAESWIARRWPGYFEPTRVPATPRD